MKMKSISVNKKCSERILHP